jgi:Amt family ammonium transporter
MTSLTPQFLPFSVWNGVYGHHDDHSDWRDGGALEFQEFHDLWILGWVLPYSLFGNWVWGGGWLAQLAMNFGLGHGTVDFAGSSVVHQTGGMIALAAHGSSALGSGNLERTASRGLCRVTISRWWGSVPSFGLRWFGFNPGSTLSGTDNRIAIIAVNRGFGNIGT